MWELVKAGGWLMAPIVLCSVFMLIIMLERGIKLTLAKVTPPQLREQLIARLKEQGDIQRDQLINVKDNSPLGDVLATGLMHRQYGLDSMTMHMENRASVQIHPKSHPACCCSPAPGPPPSRLPTATWCERSAKPDVQRCENVVSQSSSISCLPRRFKQRSARCQKVGPDK